MTASLAGLLLLLFALSTGLEKPEATAGSVVRDPGTNYTDLISRESVDPGTVKLERQITERPAPGATSPAAANPAAVPDIPEPLPPATQRDQKRTVAVSTVHTAAKTVDKRGELFIIIDDVGNSMSELQQWLELPLPLTLAVLPGLPYTGAAIRAIEQSGKAYIIHQPMEPFNYFDPGPRAVRSHMNPSEIEAVLLENMQAMPGALGMNNHMGSRITADRNAMQVVLEFLKKHDMMFIDSMTTAQSTAEEVAREVGLRFAKRNSMFLDNEQDRESIYEMLNAGLGVASRQGHAIMIGHVWSSELADLLLELYPSLLEDGFELKDVRDLLTRGDIP